MSVLAPLPVPTLHCEPDLPDEKQQLSDRQVEEIVHLYLELLRNNKKVNHSSRRDSAVVEEDEGYGTDATKLRHRSYTLHSNDSGYLSRGNTSPSGWRRQSTGGSSSPSLLSSLPSPSISRPATRGTNPPLPDLLAFVHSRESSGNNEELQAENARVQAQVSELKALLRTQGRRSTSGSTSPGIQSRPQSPQVELNTQIDILDRPRSRRSQPCISLQTQHSLFQQSSPVLPELVLPATLPAVFPPQRTEDDNWDIEASLAAAAYTVADVPATEPERVLQGNALSPPREKVNFFRRIYGKFHATYFPSSHDFPLILPSAPTDQEKLSYLSTSRPLLYTAGVFSFFSLSTGMWLFVVSSPTFAWFGVLCGALQLYMGISYWVGLVGKDFDYDGHKRILGEHPIDPESCPSVDIYLPCCKEPIDVLENTYKHVQKLVWPEGKLKVYVLDDGAMPQVEATARSYGFNYIIRGDRPRLKKAGNLRWAFARTTGDFFNIYDADFCPRPDFLLETVPRMLQDPEIAIVQTPQFFRTKSEQSWVEQGAGAIQELFYRVVQVNRDKFGASICVGSNALYRRESLVDVGGTADIGFSEDVHTGFGCVDRGWKVRYIPLNLACGICPDQPRAFFSQQMRWCMGSTTLLSNPEFWTSNLTKTQKMCYLCGMMYYSAVSLSIFVNPLPGIFMIWLRPKYFKYYNLAFAIPSLFYTLVTFRFWARASYGLNVQYIQVIQSYAYLNAIKDRVFGQALLWAPSGDNTSHKSNKYRNMRILAWTWLLTWEGALIAGMTYRIMLGMPFYNCLPLLVLDSLNAIFAHRFLFCT